MKEAVNHPKVRRFKLSVDELETLDDVKTILDLLDIRIQTDNPIWKEVGQFFNRVRPKRLYKIADKIVMKFQNCIIMR